MKRRISVRGTKMVLDVLRLVLPKDTGPACARCAKKMRKGAECCGGLQDTEGIRRCVANWSDATECQSVWWTMNTDLFRLCPYVSTGEPEGQTPWRRGFGE